MQTPSSAVRFLVVAVLLLATALFIHARRQGEPPVSRQPLAAFPREIAGMNSVDVPIPKEIQEVLGDGEFMERTYLHAGNPPMDLFIAYFPSQRTGSTMHSPKHCLPGAGWIPVESVHMKIPGTPGKTRLVNRTVIAKGNARQLVLYWYQSQGRTDASEYWARLHLAMDAIRTNRTDGALVRLITSLDEDETLESGYARTMDFAQQVLPQLNQYIPE